MSTHAKQEVRLCMSTHTKQEVRLCMSTHAKQEVRLHTSAHANQWESCNAIHANMACQYTPKRNKKANMLMHHIKQNETKPKN